MSATSKRAATPGPEIPEPTPPEGGETSSAEHEEWLLDEALAETFPASDPIAPAPGSGHR